MPYGTRIWMMDIHKVPARCTEIPDLVNVKQFDNQNKRPTNHFPKSKKRPRLDQSLIYISYFIFPTIYVAR